MTTLNAVVQFNPSIRAVREHAVYLFNEKNGAPVTVPVLSAKGGFGCTASIEASGRTYISKSSTHQGDTPSKEVQLPPQYEFQVATVVYYNHGARSFVESYCALYDDGKLVWMKMLNLDTMPIGLLNSDKPYSGPCPKGYQDVRFYEHGVGYWLIRMKDSELQDQFRAWGEGKIFQEITSHPIPAWAMDLRGTWDNAYAS